MGKTEEKGMTAAQFAKLNNISKSALLYYDSIGLFPPAGKSENGYRYYTYRQSQTLEMILTLRELNMSTEEIKAFMRSPSEEALIGIFDEKISEIDRSVKRLKEIKKLLKSRKKILEEMKGRDLRQIDRVFCEEEYLLMSLVENAWTQENETLRVIEHARKYHRHRMYNHAFGTLLDEQALLEGRFEEYAGYYTKVEKPPRNTPYFVKPAGVYLRAFSQGSWHNLPETYRRIMDYARENGIRFTGYAYEEGLNELAVSGEDEFVTQIMVQIQE